MKLLLLSIAFCSLIFLVIDIIWLSYAVKNFYRPNIGHLLLDKPVFWAAAMFYIIYVFGLAIIIIEPQIANEEHLKFIFKAFLFGVVAYGTYNLTNMATLKGWSANVVIVDMIWGGILTGVSASLSAYIVRGIIRIR